MIKPFKTTEMRWVLLHYLLPLFFMMIVFSLFGIKTINNLYLFLSYVWPLCFLTDYSKNVVGISKYKFSTLKLIFTYDESIKKIAERVLKGKLVFLKRGLPPIFFVTFVWGLFLSGYPWFALIGYGYFELIHYLFRKKFQWDPLRDNSGGEYGEH